METNAIRDYILPNDVTKYTFQEIANSHHLISPSEDYFSGLREDTVRVLGDYFDSVIVYPFNEFKAELQGVARKCSLPIITFDPAYLCPNDPNCIGTISITRAYNSDFTTFLGIVPRLGCSSIQEQIDIIAERCHSIGAQDIAVLDDVLWSGSTVSSINDMLRLKGITIRSVITGLEVVDGKTALEQKDIEVNSVSQFTKKPEAAFCQRDLLFGFPGSGRVIHSDNGGTYTLPYFSPFGGILQAHIDDELFTASTYFLQASVDFWAHIEKTIGEPVSLGLVNQIRPTPLMTQFTPETSIVKVLKSLKASEPLESVGEQVSI